MGKKLLGKRFNSSSENGLARCSWGMLHLIKYNHWTHVKKRLTYRRHSSGVTKFPTSCTDDSIDDEVPKQDYVEMDQSIVEEEGAKPSTPKKNSMKARIRALISEDMHRKKGKHHRSASCPVSHLTKSDSFHNIEPADLSPIAELVLTNASPGTIHPINETSYDANELDSMSIDSSEEPMIGNKSKECENMIVGVNSEHDQVIGNHATLRGKSAPKTPLIVKQRSSSAINSGSSLPHSKEYLDALEIININKELLLKILQDPGSPLAQHFRDQHALSSKKGLTKSESFPGPGSSRRRAFERSKLKCNQENNRSETKDEGNSDYRGPAQMPLLYAGSSQQLGNQGEDQVGVRRFKDLKHKIKHFIKESRKERHRIALDSILHKVPRGQTFSEDLEKAVDDKMKDPEIDGRSKDNLKCNNTSDEACSSNKNPVHYMRRASSLKESMDRYCHLFETTSSGDAKHHTPDRLKVRTEEAGSSFNGVLKYLGRMLSMPNLKSYFYSYEQCPDAFSSKALVTIVADGSSNIASNSDEQRNQNLSKESENLLQLDGFSGSLVQDNSDGVGEIDSTTCGELVSTSVSNNVKNFLLDSELNVGEKIMQESTLKPRHIDTQDNSIEQMNESIIDLPEVSSTLEMEKVENPNESLNFDISKFEIDAEVEAEFSYVRDILKLSGFSGNASLGSWHSNEQAVDPLLYEEVEGCFVHDPDCSGNEGGKCNHMLLFDLTNEVLIEIYGRSYNYCPIPLSSLCNIRPMPIGYHVLKEVWVLISRYLSLRPEADQSPDKVVSCDLVNDGWMNLQFDSECVGLELEDMILDDLLDELIWE